MISGETVRIGDSVLLNAEEGQPEYVARIHSMWEETKPNSDVVTSHIFRASWYFRPRDVPKTALNTLPKGTQPFAKNEIFYSDAAEENDVRSLLRLLLAVGSMVTLSRRGASRDTSGAKTPSVAHF